jgi:hypothetical protein
MIIHLLAHCAHTLIPVLPIHAHIFVRPITLPWFR